jgi:hypothetical protein
MASELALSLLHPQLSTAVSHLSPCTPFLGSSLQDYVGVAAAGRCKLRWGQPIPNGHQTEQRVCREALGARTMLYRSESWRERDART